MSAPASDMSHYPARSQSHTPATPLSRRRFGKGVLLGVSGAAAAAVIGSPTEASAARASTKWVVGGNKIAGDGTNFLGTKNVAPLIFKTALTNNNPVERLRITTTGDLGVGTSTPLARLHILSAVSTPAVLGENSSTDPDAVAVTGQITAELAAAGSVGVLGIHGGTAADGTGVRGAHAGGGVGVSASSVSGLGLSASSDAGTAVLGVGGDVGVRGEGTTYGVTGFGSGGVPAVGVYGEAPTDEESAGVGVQGVGAQGVVGTGGATGVYGTGDTNGVYGSGGTTGVYGSGDTTGVVGLAPDFGGTGCMGSGEIGVNGSTANPSGIAVFGEADNGYGVFGVSYDSGGGSTGVFGQALGDQANGVIGVANLGEGSYGVWGLSQDGYAGYFSGDAYVTGTITQGAAATEIDHPLAPSTRYLRHSVVQSPDMISVYSGNVVTDVIGNARIELPAYFEALNRDIRYQLTVVGEFAQAIVVSKVSGNAFSIKTDKPSIEVSWQVTGVRQDAFANAFRCEVEVDKPTEEQGTYLHPEAAGEPASAGMQYDRVLRLSTHVPERVANRL